MADKLGEKPNTVNQRLFQAGIKPVSKDAIYEETALEAIQSIQMGRPKKPTTNPSPEPSPKRPKTTPKTGS